MNELRREYEDDQDEEYDYVIYQIHKKDIMQSSRGS